MIIESLLLHYSTMDKIINAYNNCYIPKTECNKICSIALDNANHVLNEYLSTMDLTEFMALYHHLCAREGNIFAQAMKPSNKFKTIPDGLTAKNAFECYMNTLSLKLVDNNEKDSKFAFMFLYDVMSLATNKKPRFRPDLEIDIDIKFGKAKIFESLFDSDEDEDKAKVFKRSSSRSKILEDSDDDRRSRSKRSASKTRSKSKSKRSASKSKYELAEGDDDLYADHKPKRSASKKRVVYDSESDSESDSYSSGSQSLRINDMQRKPKQMPQLGYGQPMQQGYGQPMQQGFNQPMYQGYNQPMQQGYNQPMYPGYNQPMQQGYAQPMQHGFNQPMQHGYTQPMQQGFNQPRLNQPTQTGNPNRKCHYGKKCKRSDCKYKHPNGRTLDNKAEPEIRQVVDGNNVLRPIQPGESWADIEDNNAPKK